MNRETGDAIFALSSGLGKSGVAVIRISGQINPSSIIHYPSSIIPRHAYLTDLRDDSGALIDQIIAIYFRAPNSFTGEDVVEIHCHGASAVIEKIFEHLRTHGMRIAQPGEFSRRAFYNNKMDLPAVDGLAALLDARTDRQRMLALKSMTGGDSSVYESWRSQMVEIAAYAAAILDYASDELPENIGEKLFAQTKKLHADIRGALSGYAAARAVRGGFNIVFTGETNVGKSSLFNRLVGHARAIVSDIPGTTRDVVDAELDIDGYLVNLSDTAGIRESNDAIENIGIQRAHAEIENADLIIKVLNVECGMLNEAAKDNEIIVINKSDLIDPSSIIHHPSSIHASALTGDGIPELLDAIKQKMHAMLDGAESDIAVNERTRGLLETAADELRSALSDYRLPITDYDIFAEHARAAADAVGRILGVIGADEIADAAFGQLCLGK
ncbi:MAG: tRNA uridine-5-carboxymethylaminomethyl(34) synthesis GTPase MnmE [Rickettsiales bacterium]|jgi:tRNA modification GTPase|nr:tRNA uridine-5-carboxymethylaminomethyl(34) synthesis GTPase MnmE [Rickettsiales bacterium]